MKTDNRGCAADHCCAAVPGVDVWAAGCNRFAVKRCTVDAKRLTDGTDIETITKAVSPRLSPPQFSLIT
jgi:hypothetical protein